LRQSHVRKTVIRQLYDLGYKSAEAEGWRAGAPAVRDGLALDLLLTDVVMPGGITGYQLGDQLRIAGPELKVLLRRAIPSSPRPTPVDATAILC